LLADHGLDLRAIAGVKVNAEVSVFALLGLDVGQTRRIGFRCITSLGSLRRSVGNKRAGEDSNPRPPGSQFENGALTNLF
jgi:hypothetical protein